MKKSRTTIIPENTDSIISGGEIDMVGTYALEQDYRYPHRDIVLCYWRDFLNDVSYA